MRCGRSSRPLPMSVIRSILRYGQSRPRWILPRRSSNNLSKRPKTYLPCTKSLLNKHELRCGLQAVPNACTSSVVPLLEPEGVQLSCQSYALRLCPGSSTFLEGALSLSLPELLRREGRELCLWWDKGMRATYHQGMFSDLDTNAALEAVVTKDTSNGVRQREKRGT